MPGYATFDFPYHSVVHRYPAGDQTRFGMGYQHATEADSPGQRELILSFPTMLHIKNPHTGTWLRKDDTRVDGAEDAALTLLKKRSVICLDDFYASTRLSTRFYYTHYLFGSMVCRFAAPFEMPKVMESSRGIMNNIASDPFDVRLIEHPE
jgi:hypothetical protein